MNTLRGTKVAILVTDGFEQVEMVEPRNALEQAGASTYIVSPNSTTVQGWNHFDKGDFFNVDVLLSKANAEDFDALLLPGGVANPDTLRLIPEAISFVQKMNVLRKPIAAICHGPWILINAGFVKGRQLTSWSSIRTDLINAGAKWIDKAAVLDGTLLTSRNPKDIPQFNEAMIQLFSSVQHKAA